MKVAILGSSGAMGSFFVAHFLGRGDEVVGYDSVRSESPRSPRFAFAESNSNAVRGCDVVLIAVPIRDTVEVLREVAGSLGNGTLVVEISSVKGTLFEEIRRTRSKATLLSLHPLFGPSFASDRLPLCVVGREKEVRLARRLFPKAHLIQLGPEEHDRLMAYALSLVHLTNLAFVSAVSKGVGLKQFQKTSTPTSRVQLTLAKAVLSQSPTLYSCINTENPFVGEAIDSMIAELRDLRRIAVGRHSKKFEARFSSIASAFGRGELERALGEVYSLATE